MRVLFTLVLLFPLAACSLFPPVAAVIPYVPEVPLAQNKGRSGLEASDEFARPIHNIAEMLFGSTVGVNARNNDSGRTVKKFGPLKIRVK